MISRINKTYPIEVGKFYFMKVLHTSGGVELVEVVSIDAATFNAANSTVLYTNHSQDKSRRESQSVFEHRVAEGMGIMQDRVSKLPAVADKSFLLGVLESGQSNQHPRRKLFSDPTKIKVQEIRLVRAEGPADECGLPHVCNTWNSANEILCGWARTVAGGYDKCNFKVTFADGETYSGRYDLEADETETADVAGHIYRHLAWYANIFWPVHRTLDQVNETPEEFQKWLDTYDLNGWNGVDEKPVPPPAFAVGSHVELKLYSFTNVVKRSTAPVEQRLGTVVRVEPRDKKILNDGDPYNYTIQFKDGETIEGYSSAMLDKTFWTPTATSEYSPDLSILQIVYLRGDVLRVVAVLENYVICRGEHVWTLSAKGFSPLPSTI